MIIDTLENFGKYVGLNPRFQQVAEYLRTHVLSSQPQGRQVLDGSDLFVNFDSAKGKTPVEARLESHNEMIDIQIPISTVETMGYTPRQSLAEASYNEEKDITFYEGMAQQYLAVMPGMFVIFFPQDAHAPCISTEPTIQKAIFKVRN